MRKLRCILKDTRGEAFPLTVAIVLALLLLFCGVSEYFRLTAIARNVRDVLQNAVISTVNDNYDDVYHGVREGYSGAYQPIGGSFESSLDYGDIYARLDESLGLSASGSYHVRMTSDGQTEYQLWGLDIDISNAPFASGDSSTTRFTVDCTVKLEVPISFCGRILPRMRMTVQCRAGYTPKF